MLVSIVCSYESMILKRESEVGGGGLYHRAKLFLTSCEMQAWGSLGTEIYTGVWRDKLPLYLSPPFHNEIS